MATGEQCRRGTLVTGSMIALVAGSFYAKKWPGPGSASKDAEWSSDGSGHHYYGFRDGTPATRKSGGGS